MENQSKTVPIIFCNKRTKYRNSSPIISWTSEFSESVQIQHLTYLPTKKWKQSRAAQEAMTSVVELDQLSSPFLALQPYDMCNKRIFKIQCYTNSDNLNLVNSTNLFLGSTGGILSIPRTDDRHYFEYAIHCCVRPRLRCCVNDLPVEILELVFSSLEHDSFNDASFEAVPLVCKLWRKVFVAFEGDPIKADRKFARLKESPVKRLKWNTCDYYQDDVVNFCEYIHAVVQYQPFLRLVEIHRPSQDSPLKELLILAKVPTIDEVNLNSWNAQEVFSFLRTRQHLKLTEMNICNMIEGDHDFTDITPSTFEIQSGLTRVRSLRIKTFGDWIHEILGCLQKDYLQVLNLSYNPGTLEPLKKSIQLFGFGNIDSIELDGGNDESNLVSFDFISTTCTPLNLPKIRSLDLQYCFIDPTEVQYFLQMPELKDVHIILFMGQKTEQNEQTTRQVSEGFISKNKDSRCDLLYSSGDESDGNI